MSPINLDDWTRRSLLQRQAQEAGGKIEEEHARRSKSRVAASLDLKDRLEGRRAKTLYQEIERLQQSGEGLLFAQSLQRCTSLKQLLELILLSELPILSSNDTENNFKVNDACTRQRTEKTIIELMKEEAKIKSGISLGPLEAKHILQCEINITIPDIYGLRDCIARILKLNEFLLETDEMPWDFSRTEFPSQEEPPTPDDGIPF